MLVTNNKKLFELCKFFRDQGRNKFQTYNIDELGFKYMPFNLQAALGYSQFKRINCYLKLYCIIINTLIFPFFN